MTQHDPRTVYLRDYTPPAYLVDEVRLTFRLAPHATRVLSEIRFRPNPDATGRDFFLHGEGLKLISAHINGAQVTPELIEGGLTLDAPDAPDALDAIKAQRPALVWIESPTNPLMKVLDIAAIAEVCNTADSPLVVDNTFASPYVQRPVALGATLSLSSTTKYINGHSDVVMGFVGVNDDELNDKLRFIQNGLGAVPSPFDSNPVASMGRQ